MRSTLVYIALLLMSACSSLHDSSPLVTTLSSAPLLKAIPNQPKAHLFTANHHLTLTIGERSHRFLTHLEVANEHLSFVGFGLLGEVLFECSNTLNSKTCSSANNRIPANMLLKDIQTIYWPIDSVRAQFKSAQFTLEDKGLKRTLFEGDKVLSEIFYSQTTRWQAEVTLNNKRYHYQLHLRPLNKANTDE